MSEPDLALLNAVPLAEILRSQGFEPRDPGNVQWRRDERTIEITGLAYLEPKFNAIGRGSIDLACRLTGLDAPDALGWLQDVLAGRAPRSIERRRPGDLRPRTLRLPLRHDHQLTAMHRDLCMKLGISDALVREMIAMGRLYADEKGRAVALMRNNDQVAVGAEVITISSDGRVSMQFCHGTERGQGAFFINGKDRQHGRIVLVESALEALAYVSLKPRDSAISLGGIFNHDLLDWMGNALVERDAPVFAGHGTAALSVIGAHHLNPRFGWAHLTPSTFHPGASSWLHLVDLQRVKEQSGTMVPV